MSTKISFIFLFRNLFSFSGISWNFLSFFFVPVSYFIFWTAIAELHVRCSPFALWLWSAILAFKELYLNLCPVLNYVNRIRASILLTLLFQRAERCHSVLNYKIVDGLCRSTWPLSRKNWNLIAHHWKKKKEEFLKSLSQCVKKRCLYSKVRLCLWNKRFRILGCILEIHFRNSCSGNVLLLKQRLFIFLQKNLADSLSCPVQLHKFSKFAYEVCPVFPLLHSCWCCCLYNWRLDCVW